MSQISFAAFGATSLHSVIPDGLPPMTASSAAAATLQEATETPFQTAEEARDGDPAAIERLRQEQVSDILEPWKGKAIDQVA